MKKMLAFVLELVYARNAFCPEDWFLAVYPWSAPPLINFAVTRLDSARSQAWMLPKLAA